MPLTRSTCRPALIGVTAALVVLGSAFLAWQRLGPRPVTVSVGKFPEQFVYVRSDDDVVNAGAMFTAKESPRHLAVLWIHGWGANFYSPTYVMVGRALAERRLTTITANTRMHDIANVQQFRNGKRIRGGGYWGIPSEQVRDIAAWVDFTEQQGFAHIVLVGHSAGWAAVRAYLAERQDARIAGAVLASGQVQPASGTPDQEVIAEAKRLVRDGRGDDLLRLPNRSFPSFISAGTFLDDHNTPRHVLDFFGVQNENAAIARVSCPLLAFFGTRGDVGSDAELQLLRSSVERHRSGSRGVTVAMIQNADHMYTGEEQQVARLISDWVDRVVVTSATTR